jgi:hypothetical protein
MVKKAGDETDPTAAASVIESFFDLTLLPESLERFNNLLNDPEKIVSVETLSEITGWLVGEYSERPTKEPERSSNGQ